MTLSIFITLTIMKLTITGAGTLCTVRGAGLFSTETLNFIMPVLHSFNVTYKKISIASILRRYTSLVTMNRKQDVVSYIIMNLFVEMG